MKSFIDYTVSSFSRIFKFDIDHLLSEDENVRCIIHQTSFVCSALTWIQPIPLADFMILTPLHAKMTVHIGKAKGFDISDECALEIFQELIGSVGLAFVASQVIIGVGKFVPVVLGIYLFPLFYASTWAMGKVVEHYFEGRKTGDQTDAEDLRRVYKKALISGKVLASKLSLDEIKKKAYELKAKFHGDTDFEAADSSDPRPRETEHSPIRAKLAGEKKQGGKQASSGYFSKIAVNNPEQGPKNESQDPENTETEPSQSKIAEEFDQEDPIEALEQLGRLLRDGTIKTEEFQRERRRLLKRL
jgi:uncharacterized protein (DUF697 family)